MAHKRKLRGKGPPPKGKKFNQQHFTKCVLTVNIGVFLFL
jgi:hypothetical protein